MLVLRLYEGLSPIALVAPAGIVTLDGTVTLGELELAKETVVGDEDAALIVTVPCEELPPATLAGFKLREESDGPAGGGRTVRTALPVESLDELAHRELGRRVEPDRRPVVRIRTPGKDLMFAEAKGQVAVEIEARDDLAVAALVLRYTRVAGSGETRRDVGGIVRVGETSPDAMREKAQHVVGVMRDRLHGLGADWADVTAVNVYTALPIEGYLTEVILKAVGPAAAHGVQWFLSRPPVKQLEFEMDMRGVSRRLYL